MTNDKEYAEASRKFALWVCEVMIDMEMSYSYVAPCTNHYTGQGCHLIFITWMENGGGLDRRRGLHIDIPTARNDDYAVQVQCFWPSPTKEYYTSKTFGPAAIDCVLIAANWLASTRWPGADGKPIEPPTPQEEWNR